MRRQGRDAEARPKVEGCRIRQANGLARGNRHELLSGAVGALPGRLPQPDPLTARPESTPSPTASIVPAPS